MISKIKSLFSREDGTAGIEFALLGFPFIVLILGILETSLYFASGVILEGATADAARMVRTGQIQEESGGGGGGIGFGEPQDQFRDVLCGKTARLILCRQIQFDAIRVPDNMFSNVDRLLRPEFNEDGKMITQGFSPGGASDVVLIRVFYRYRFMIPLIESMMQNREGRSGDLLSIAIIRNEPYDDGA